MAKRKSSKSKRSLICTIIVMVFGVVLFTTMFMPLMSATVLGETTSITIADAIGNDLGDNGAYVVMIIAGFISALLGAGMFVLALLSLFLKGKLLGKINLILGLAALVLAVVSMICMFVYLGQDQGFGITVGDVFSVSAGSFVALGSALIAPIAIKIKK